VTNTIAIWYRTNKGVKKFLMHRHWDSYFMKHVSLNWSGTQTS